MQIKIFGRDPALALALISAVIGLLVTFNFTWLSDNQALAITGVVTTGFGILTALATRPIAVTAFTTAVASLVVLVTAYGLEVPREFVGAAQALVVTVLAFFAREKITPNHDPRPLAGETTAAARMAAPSPRY